MALIAWLPFVKDSRQQGLGSDVSITGTISLDNSGKLGKCLNSSNEVAINTNHSFGKVWSFCFWGYVNGSSVTSNWTQIARINDGSSNLRIEVCPSSYSNGIYCYSTHNNTGYAITNGSIASPSGGYYNQWAHFCLTSDGTTITKYMNGVSIGTCVYNGSGTITGTFVLSNNHITKKNDARIYDHCLSPMEVRELAKGLVLHYPLNRGGWGQENLLSRYVVPGQAAPTSTAAGGRTTWLGDYKITIPATENADTYFRLFTTKQLTTNATYTISCNVEGLLSGSYYRFPLYAQGNTAMGVLNLDHNGLCSLTFTMTYGTQTAATGANGETVYICFMDDSTRAIASGQGAITISNFKLEEGSIATPWCPNSSDALATTMGLNSTTEYDCSGFCNNGTRIGTFTWTSDTPKYAVSTKLTTGSKITSSTGMITTANPTFTCNFWVKMPSATYTTWADIITFPGSAIIRMETCNTAGTDLAWFNYPIGTSGGVGTGTVNNTDWNMFTLTCDGSNWKTYKNAVLVNTVAISGTVWTPNGTVSIGDNGMYAQLSDVRIYATALTQTDIESLYNNAAYIDSSGNVYGAVHSEV